MNGSSLDTLLTRILGSGASFRDPEWLLLLLVLPVSIAVYVIRERRGTGAFVVPSLEMVGHVKPTWRVRFRWLPFALANLGLALLVLALARPRLGLERTESWTEGVDIFMVLDGSGSMAAEDFKPKNRFVVAKACARDFIEGRSSDRIGLLTFAGRSRTIAPLTTDRSMVLTRLAELRMGEMGDGTAIGLALGNALSRLRPSKAKSKVIILLTDGANNAGEIDPDTATGIAKAMGIKVYTIGVGTNSGKPVEIPVQVKDEETGRIVERRITANVDVDEPLLGRIAKETGGRFFRATDAKGLAETFSAIDALEKTEIKTTKYTRWREAFHKIALAGAAFLAAAALLSAFVFPVTPR